MEGEAARAYLAKAASEGLGVDALLAQAQAFQSEGSWGCLAAVFQSGERRFCRSGHDAGPAGGSCVFQGGSTVLSQPDVVQAHKWYEQARRNGSGVAQQRLQQLLVELEKRPAQAMSRRPYCWKMEMKQMMKIGGLGLLVLLVLLGGQALADTKSHCSWKASRRSISGCWPFRMPVSMISREMNRYGGYAIQRLLCL